MLFSIALVLIVVELIFLLISVASERPYMGFLSLLLTCGFLDYFYQAGIYSSIIHNPGLFAGLVAGYVLVGVLWSFPKWWFYVHSIKDAYVKSLAAYKKTNRIPENQKLDSQQIHEFYYSRSFEADGFFEPRRKYWGEIMPLQASKNKNKILVWMMYWPLSVLWTLINDPVRKAFMFVFEHVKGVYQLITAKAFDGIQVKDS